MAAHALVDTFDNKVIQRIARGVRNQVSFSGSLKYEEIKDERYRETPEDRVFFKSCTVPQSIVTGGKAIIEVHTKPRKGYGQIATNIYLVA